MTESGVHADVMALVHLLRLPIPCIKFTTDILILLTFSTDHHNLMGVASLLNSRATTADTSEHLRHDLAAIRL